MKLPPQVQKMMKEIQKVQKRLQELEEQLENMTVSAQVGGGMVTVTANGKEEIVKVEVEEELLNPEEKEMLQDLIVAGVNEALRKAREMKEQEIAKLTSGFKLPPGFNLPGMF